MRKLLSFLKPVAVAESFEALAFLFLLIGFYMFYKAWNPRAMAKAG